MTTAAERDMSYWPTPADVADDLLMMAICPGYGDGGASRDGEVPQVRVLEPSAGEGHIVRAIRQHLPAAHITAVEPDPGRADALRSAHGLADQVMRSTLEDYLAAAAMAAFAGDWQPFDLVIANPPFTLPGRPEAWAEHILALYNDPHVLNPGAVIAAVVPHIVLTGKSKLVRGVRDLLGRCGEVEPCDRGAFAAGRAQVSTALMWTQKPFGADTGPA